MVLPSVMLMKMCWQITLLHLKLVMGQLLLLNVFNAADAHKLIKNRRVIQVELLGMRFVQKESYEVAISEKKKVCENLKGVIDTKYSDFDEPVFQKMKWFDPQTWDQERQEAGQITSFYEHFKEPLANANFQLNFCLKEFKKFKKLCPCKSRRKKK